MSSDVKEDFKFKYEINKWEQKTNKTTGNLEFIFDVEVSSLITNKKWSVYHSINDFKDLVTNLSSTYLNIPECPGLFNNEKEKGTSSIEKTLSAFHEFIGKISHRADVFNSKYFIDFFNLENHYEDIKKYLPKIKFKISNLKFEVSEMIFIEREDILIVGCAVNSEQNILSMSTINKMQFWKKPEDKGEILFYKLNFKKREEDLTAAEKSTPETFYELLNKINTLDEVSCFCLSEDINYLIVGYFKGNIDIFELPEDLNYLNVNKKLEPKNTFQINIKKNRIINIGYNLETKYIFSTCYKDINIYTNLIDNKTITNIPGSQDDLVGFCYIDKYETLNDVVFYIDNKGKLSIGTVSIEEKNVNLLYVLSTQFNNITLFNVNWENNHIYLGDKNGNLNVISFELILPENTENNDENSNQKKMNLKIIFNISLNTFVDNAAKKFTKIIMNSYPYKIKNVSYNPRKKELLIALGNGTIQILTHFKDFSECALCENTKPLNKIYYSKSKSVVISGGVEKDICVYQMPENYLSELCRKLEVSNSHEILTDNNVCKNEIENGHSKDTKLFKRRTILDKLPDPK